jgi:hypothetical protein
MVELPDTDDMTSTGMSSAKAAGGAIIGAQLGQQFVGGNLGAVLGGLGGSIMTGKSPENKAAATFVMMNALPQLLSGSGLGGMAGGNSQQQMAGTPTL